MVKVGLMVGRMVMMMANEEGGLIDDDNKGAHVGWDDGEN